MIDVAFAISVTEGDSQIASVSVVAVQCQSWRRNRVYILIVVSKRNGCIIRQCTVAGRISYGQDIYAIADAIANQLSIDIAVAEFSTCVM